MSAVTIRRIATVDGRDVPLAECSWLHVAPCGCACGIAMADIGDRAIADEVAAMVEFTSTQTQREADRDRVAGFSVRLIRTEEFRQNRDLLTVKCPHEPQWGVEKTPVPDGYNWAATRSLGRRLLYKHLAPIAATVTEPRGEWPAAEVRGTALCGSGDKYTVWFSYDAYTFATMECSRCAAAAKRAVAA